MSCRHLEIRNLTVDLHGPKPRRLVDGLSLAVPGGKTVALVGESGAGKSMTALAIMGLLPPGIRRSGGEILVDHRSLDAMEADSRRRFRNGTVSVVLQNPMSAFDPVFSIGAHFRETIAAHKPLSRREARALAAAALARTGFSDPEGILDIYPCQMSGGMLQRVMIALALITEPEYLIADEATTDLDTVAQARVLDILRERRAEGHLGQLIITHDLGVAAALADEVAVMRHGKLVEHGAAADVFSAPRSEYARELVETYRRLYGRGLAAFAQAAEGARQ